MSDQWQYGEMGVNEYSSSPRTPRGAAQRSNDPFTILRDLAALARLNAEYRENATIRGALRDEDIGLQRQEFERYRQTPTSGSDAWLRNPRLHPDVVRTRQRRMDRRPAPAPSRAMQEDMTGQYGPVVGNARRLLDSLFGGR